MPSANVAAAEARMGKSQVVDWAGRDTSSSKSSGANLGSGGLGKLKLLGHHKLDECAHVFSRCRSGNTEVAKRNSRRPANEDEEIPEDNPVAELCHHPAHACTGVPRSEDWNSSQNIFHGYGV